MEDPERCSEQNEKTLPSNWVGNQDIKFSYNKNNNTQNVSEKCIFGRQILAITAPFIITVVRGLNSGYSTTLLPELSERKLQMTISQMSWIASITILSMPIGAVLSGITLEKLGRKTSNMISFPLTSLSWLLFLISESVEMILTARFFTGLTSGFSLAASSIYVVEVTNPEYRGIFLAIISTASSLGMLVIHLIDTYLSYKITAGICAIIPISCIATMYFSPESPQWLLKNGKSVEAIESFYWLRGRSKETEKELNELINGITEEDDGKIGQLEIKQKPLWADSAFWKPFLIVTVLCLASQWSGYSSIEFYSVSMAKETFGGGEYEITILMDVVRLFFSGVACILCKKLNRRPHTIYSGIGGGISMVLFAVLLVYKSIVGPLVVLLVLLLYLSFMTAGIAHLPSIIAAELFPYRMRGLGLACLACLICISTFLVVKLGPAMFITMGMVANFTFYGMACLMGTFILYFILPETKDKSLLEIENLFAKQKPNLEELN